MFAPAQCCLFIILLQFDDGQTEYDGEVSIDAVKKFIQTESLPLVVEFNHDTAQKIFGGDIKSHLLMFLSQSASNYEELLKSAKSVAGPFRDRVSVTWHSSVLLLLTYEFQRWEVNGTDNFGPTRNLALIDLFLCACDKAIGGFSSSAFSWIEKKKCFLK